MICGLHFILSYLLVVDCDSVNMPRFKRQKRQKFGWHLSQPNLAIRRPRPTSPEKDEPKKDSTAKKKLGNDLDYSQFNDEWNYDIVNLDIVDEIISEMAVCKHCFSTLALSVTNRVGLACTLSLKCTNEVCGHKIKKPNSQYSKVTIGIDNEEYRAYDINVRYVYALRSIGIGQETGETFASVMNLPKPSKFAKYNQMLLTVAQMVCVQSMKEAVEKAVQQNDGDRDITCAFDGSWQRRGFSSLNGVMTATSVTSGQVVDVEVMSKFCQCKERLENQHDNSCIANYSGTSGGMEVEGVTKMFARSQENYGIRYKNYLGDGDCKGFETVCAQQPYGPDFKIEKLECLGHVQKRMGKRLRNYKQKNSKKILSDGKKIGGQGRLTGHAIDTIQLYYGLAIRRNSMMGVQAMRSAIWAEYFHLGSTDENPEHRLCPSDSDTWCKYQKAKLENTVYRHSEHTHLPLVVLEEIKPIFRDLSNPVLLAKCAHGGTQNISESLNHVIWCRIPKAVFVRLNTLKLGVYDAISSYNKGNVSKCLIFKLMGLTPGKNCVEGMKLLDARRIRRAEKAIEEVQKKCRQQTSLKKRKLEDEFHENEDPDNPAYSPGHY